MAKNARTDEAERTFVTLKWISERWDCSRQTVRRTLERARIFPFYFGSDASNGTVRFSYEDVLAFEAESRADHLKRLP